jgi:hypothetical protein
MFSLICRIWNLKKIFFKDIKSEGGHLGRGRGPAEGGSG